MQGTCRWANLAMTIYHSSTVDSLQWHAGYSSCPDLLAIRAISMIWSEFGVQTTKMSMQQYHLPGIGLADIAFAAAGSFINAQALQRYAACL